jgi:hypothetical protein
MTRHPAALFVLHPAAAAATGKRAWRYKARLGEVLWGASDYDPLSLAVDSCAAKSRKLPTKP